MNQSAVNILSLCDEMLLNIFNKLNNVDVLYSIIGVNQKLDKLVQDITFTRSIDLVTISSNENNDLKTNSILDRFYFDVIPRIQHNIECLTLDPLSIDRFLHIETYPKLYKLNLVNLQFEMASLIFNDESSFIRRFKLQISHLIVTIDDDIIGKQAIKLSTNIFTNILNTFTNLTHLDFQSEDTNFLAPTSLIDLSSTSCYSSKIVYLNVRMKTFDDCFCLLDGRLSQLHTFIIEVYEIKNSSMTLDNKKTLSKLKCFSLVLIRRTDMYDTRIVPLLRQMLHLEKLTLSLVVHRRTSFIDGTQLSNDILCKMPHLQTFIFDIATTNVVFHQELLPSSDDIRRTYIERGYHADCFIDYYPLGLNLCHVYSLPFTMKRMKNISNSFPGGLFMSVRKLNLDDFLVQFEHDFFARISQAFPLLNQLGIFNTHGQQKKLVYQLNEHEQTTSIIEYSHLVKLYLKSAHIDYLKQFLLNSNTRLPCLNTLSANYEDLKTVTENFTSDATRANCAKLEYIIFESIPIVYSENFYLLFSSCK